MSIFIWRKLFILVFIPVFLSCSKDQEPLDNFDYQVWKEDIGACNGKRQELGETLLKQKDKLLALDEMQMVNELGKPDAHELFKRNEKFFYYYLQPSRDCATFNGKTSRLVIRFNAVGLAKEIYTE